MEEIGQAVGRLGWLSSFIDHHISFGMLLTAAVLIIFMWKALPLIMKRSSQKKDAEQQAQINANTDRLVAVSDRIAGVEAYTRRNHARLDYVEEMLVELKQRASKNMFYGKENPPMQRLIAGIEYILDGGNGETKPDIVEFIKNNRTTWRACQLARPKQVKEFLAKIQTLKTAEEL